MDYAVGTIHGQAFGRVFMPVRFEPQDPVHQTLGLGQGSVKKQGQQMIEEAFAIVDAQLAGREWAAGDRFGIADAALFYVERWASEADVKLPANLAAHLERMETRPAVRKVMQVWGKPDVGEVTASPLGSTAWLGHRCAMKVFLDFEASSLADRSYPIEVAWVFRTAAPRVI